MIISNTVEPLYYEHFGPKNCPYYGGFLYCVLNLGNLLREVPLYHDIYLFSTQHNIINNVKGISMASNWPSNKPEKAKQPLSTFPNVLVHCN